MYDNRRSEPVRAQEQSSHATHVATAQRGCTSCSSSAWGARSLRTPLRDPVDGFSSAASWTGEGRLQPLALREPDHDTELWVYLGSECARPCHCTTSVGWFPTLYLRRDTWDRFRGSSSSLTGSHFLSLPLPKGSHRARCERRSQLTGEIPRPTIATPKRSEGPGESF